MGKLGKRSIVYIDGFNLYFGVLKDSPHQWLNLQHYFQLLRQDDDIQKIWYFTAEMLGQQAHANQAAYLEALRTLPLVEVVLGLYKLKNTTCYVPRCRYPGRRVYKIPEEKKTDVNIAVHMLDDAYRGCCERIVLVSGDSDLVPAINIIKDRQPHIEVIVYIPSKHPNRGAARELRDSADKNRTLPQSLLSKTQFPTSLVNAAGSRIQKPANW